MIIPFFLRPLLELGRMVERGPIYADTDTLDYIPNTWKGSRTRNPTRIKRIVVHQTGVEFGVSSRQLKRAGSVTEARRRRFMATPYHYVITLRGELLRIHPIHRWTYHAGPANREAIGVAFEGRFPRFERERRDRHTTLDTLQVRRWQELFERVLELHPNLSVVTHRQASKRRLADPGEVIMREVVRGQRLDRAWTIGSGCPCPKEWLP